MTDNATNIPSADESQEAIRQLRVVERELLQLRNAQRREQRQIESARRWHERAERLREEVRRLCGPSSDQQSA